VNIFAQNKITIIPFMAPETRAEVGILLASSLILCRNQDDVL